MTRPLLDVLEQALGFADGVFERAPEATRAARTPCPDFDVDGLAAHVVAGLRWFGELPAGGSTDPTAVPSPDLRGRPLVGPYREAVDLIGRSWTEEHLDETFAMPFGDITGAGIAAFTVVEVVAHGWDLAVATGQRTRPPDDLVDAALAMARDLGDETLRSPGMMATAVDVPDDAPVLDRFVAFLGRDPAWAAEADG